MHPHCEEFLRLRQGSGWTNSRIAQELGLHPTVIWKYANGITHPSIHVLRLFSGLTDEPLSLPGEAPLQFRDGPRFLTDWESDIIRLLRRIDADPRKRVITALRELIDACVSPVTYRKRRRNGSNQTEDGVKPLPGVAAAIANSKAMSVVSESTHEPAGEDASTTAPPDATPSHKRKRASGPQAEPQHLRSNDSESPKQTPGNAPKDRAGRTP